MPLCRSLLLFCLLLCQPLTAAAASITIAAASDLKFAMDEVIAAFKQRHPGDQVEVVYGSSGKFQTQIRLGAPYDLYFSADIAYPRALAEAGLAASPVTPYAHGRLVLWSTRPDSRTLTLAGLADPAIGRIAIANPRHAPYGKRAVEALQAAGVWSRGEARLVQGESVSHAAQFVQSGNAQVGIIALALALSPELARLGGYQLIPDSLHAPLEQGFIITRRAAGNALARRFAAHMQADDTRALMQRYGFVLPERERR